MRFVIVMAMTVALIVVVVVIVNPFVFVVIVVAEAAVVIIIVVVITIVVVVVITKVLFLQHATWRWCRWRLRWHTTPVALPAASQSLTSPKCICLAVIGSR